MPGVLPLHKVEGASDDTVGLNGIEANLNVGSTCLAAWKKRTYTATILFLSGGYIYFKSKINIRPYTCKLFMTIWKKGKVILQAVCLKSFEVFYFPLLISFSASKLLPDGKNAAFL